jgi:hypothetical protein
MSDSNKKKNTPRVFYAFFWKSYYRRAKKHKWCIQFKGKRHIVNSFTIKVPTQSKSRNRNPHAVLYGKATRLLLRNGHATLC